MQLRGPVRVGSQSGCAGASEGVCAMMRIAGQLLGSIVASPFFVPFSAISAPNGLSPPDSECTRGDQQRAEGDEDNGGMHGRRDEDEDTTDAKQTPQRRGEDPTERTREKEGKNGGAGEERDDPSNECAHE